MAGAYPGHAEHARLFVALWPDIEVRDALQAWCGQWQWPAATQRVPAQQLHLTLHFLGDVPRDQLPALQAALRVPFTPFVLSLGRVALWPGGIAVLEPDRLPPPMARLHGAIGEALHGLDMATEARAFRPHVSLARRAAAAVAPSAGPCIRWPVGGFALVESHRPPRGGYEIVQAYP